MMRASNSVPSTASALDPCGVMLAIVTAPPSRTNRPLEDGRSTQHIDSALGRQPACMLCASHFRSDVGDLCDEEYFSAPEGRAYVPPYVRGSSQNTAWARSRGKADLGDASIGSVPPSLGRALDQGYLLTLGVARVPARDPDQSADEAR